MAIKTAKTYGSDIHHAFAELCKALAQDKEAKGKLKDLRLHMMDYLESDDLHVPMLEKRADGIVWLENRFRVLLVEYDIPYVLGLPGYTRGKTVYSEPVKHVYVDVVALDSDDTLCAIDLKFSQKPLSYHDVRRALYDAQVGCYAHLLSKALQVNNVRRVIIDYHPQGVSVLDNEELMREPEDGAFAWLKQNNPKWRGTTLGKVCVFPHSTWEYSNGISFFRGYEQRWKYVTDSNIYGKIDEGDVCDVLAISSPRFAYLRNKPLWDELNGEDHYFSQLIQDVSRGFALPEDGPDAEKVLWASERFFHMDKMDKCSHSEFCASVIIGLKVFKYALGNQFDFIEYIRRRNFEHFSKMKGWTQGDAKSATEDVVKRTDKCMRFLRERLEYLLNLGNASWDAIHLKDIVLALKLEELEDRTWFLQPEGWDDWWYEYERK